MQPTPASNSPTESPSHSSYCRHSRASSSSSRFSGTFRSAFGWKANRKRNDKGWPHCVVIEEEGNYNNLYGDSRGYARRCQALIAVFGFVAIFSVFCLILWGVGRSYKARVSVKSFTVQKFYFGEGSDLTGVPTKMLTVNSSVRMSIYNPATFFGIHVSSMPINLMYYKITVATGELEKYYQPRKSHRTVSVDLQGNNVPLYGAEASLVGLDNNGEVPVVLSFDMRSRGNVVGGLVRSRQRLHVSCSLVLDSHNNKPIKLEEKSCTYG